MKLKNIKIEKLFGLENNDFDIILYPNELVTILYGINGIGKTSIIKLISAAISCDLLKLFAMKFQSLVITFEDDSRIEVKCDSELSARVLRQISKRDNSIAYHPISYTLFDSNGKSELYKFQLVGAEIHIAHEYRYPECLNEESKELLRKLQKELNAKIDLHVIFANRDFNRVVNPKLFGDRVLFEDDNLNKKLITCSKLEALAIYNCLKKQFEDDKSNNPKQSDPDANQSFSTVPEYYYYADIPDKLEELLEILQKEKKSNITKEKIDLFEEILNERLGLIYKKVRLSKNGLLSFENENFSDVKIEPYMLSSGEKNILCLFLELIFIGNENSVFILDEPEASLHIDWMQSLIRCILYVCSKIHQMQVIPVTHSPDVVDDYWGLQSEIISARFKSGN